MKSLGSKSLTQSGQRQSLFRGLHNIFNSTEFTEVKFFSIFIYGGRLNLCPSFKGWIARWKSHRWLSREKL